MNAKQPLNGNMLLNRSGALNGNARAVDVSGNHPLSQEAGLLLSSGTMTDSDDDDDERELGEGVGGVEHIILEPPPKSLTQV